MAAPEACACADLPKGIARPSVSVPAAALAVATAVPPRKPRRLSVGAPSTAWPRVGVLGIVVVEHRSGHGAVLVFGAQAFCGQGIMPAAILMPVRTRL